MIENKSANLNQLADDLIWGIDGNNGIAAFLGISPRKCYYLIEQGKIPVQKLGHKTVAASRNQLRRHFGVLPVA